MSSAPVPKVTLICGKGRIATLALSHAAHSVAVQGLTTQVVACPNVDDKGYDGWQASLVRAAALLEVPIVTLEDVQDEPDLLLMSLEYDRIIRVARFASRRLFNIHFSALPQYRGVYTSMWPLLRGEREIGVTLHYMDPGVDTGAIVAQRRALLPPDATARQLYEIYTDEGLTLFREWLPNLLVTLPPASAQDETKASSFDRRSLDPRRTEVDLEQDLSRVCSFIRAYTFPEYQLPTCGGRAIRYCAPLSTTTAAPPGTVLHETAFSSAIATGGGGVIELVWA